MCNQNFTTIFWLNLFIQLTRICSFYRSSLSWISSSVTSSVSQFCATLQLQLRNLKTYTGPTSHNIGKNKHNTLAFS